MPWVVGTVRATHVDAGDGVAVTLLWPTVPTELVFSSCYAPTAARGVVTKADGREAVEIDGRPAAEVLSSRLVLDSALCADRPDRVLCRCTPSGQALSWRGSKVQRRHHRGSRSLMQICSDFRLSARWQV